MHNGIRLWIELKPDAPVCGNDSIELYFNTGQDKQDQAKNVWLQTLRGCTVTLTGPLAIPGTGYYSAPVYMKIKSAEVDPKCLRKKALPDYSRDRPPRRVTRYDVTMNVHYHDERPVDAVIRSEGHPLAPWQAYANYDLTGGFVFYGHCADDFSMKAVRGTPETKPWQVDENIAAMDPESAAAKGVWEQHLSFTCKRYR